MKEACKKLENKYPEYGTTKVRGNGMSEFVLKKIQSRNEEVVINGKIRNKTKKNIKINKKTRKNKKMT